MEIKLNAEQKQAVTHNEGPLLIVAGAGTGKTAVITQRIAWLIKEKKLKPENILALTFTEKAAEEMEIRVDKELPYGYVELWISTFHAFCQRVLKDHGIDIGLPDGFKVMTPTQSWLLVRQHLEDFDLDYYRPLGNPTKFIHALIQHFSRAKDETIYPKDYLEYAESLQLDLDNVGFAVKGKKKAAESDEKVIMEQNVKRYQEIANAYHFYQKILLDNNALDFGDLINFTLKLFKERPAILKKYREQFKYLLVDEFQDTNYAQYELIKLLASPNNNITVVGDDDQCLPASAKIQTVKGKKQIKDMEVGDEVLTAIGRGHLGISKVTKKFINTKNVRYLTITTSKGKKIVVTDNHKMFCRVPAIGKSGYWYVYLMERQGLGWRIGITNDLAQRLRLERSADRIIAVKAFNNEVEARFWETVWSLKYSIPTVCFKTSRQGIIMNNDLLKQLYSLLEVDKGVKRLADDLNIDLKSHHVSLGAVIRGNKKRVKLYLDLCYRNYRSKGKIRIMQQPKILHLLSLDTSDQGTVRKIKQAGFKMTKSSKGWRLRMASKDIRKLGRNLSKLEKIVGGITEFRFQVAKTNKQHLISLVMPAKNVCLGMLLPVLKGQEIIYDSVVTIDIKEKRDTVYDLEIADTHNFIADDIVVHNSIYKFRGASISNILEFKKDYPKVKEVYLNKNYRSAQNILDLSYKFIQLNNPNRLEVKLSSETNKLTKELKSQLKSKGEIEYYQASSLETEIAWVIKKIHSIYLADKDTDWSDFAILVRANDAAKPFQDSLQSNNIPHYFLASHGLYYKKVVKDILAFLKLLDNYHESPALWRILNLPFFELADRDLIRLSHQAYRKQWSLYDALTKVGGQINYPTEVVSKFAKVLELINKHTAMTRDKTVWPIIYSWLTDSGYLKYLDKLNEYQRQEQFNYLNSFYKKIKQFEANTDEPSVKNFISDMKYELESGEQGSIAFDAEQGPETVKIMTVHGAKGLEFKHVFIVNMVDQRFPTINRKDPIELPDELVKEILPEGDVHIQEERRLFYVAMTRAKQSLYLTSGEDYGGMRKKKPSRFLLETNMISEDVKPKAKEVKKLKDDKVINKKDKGKIDYQEMVPKYFSFSQLKAFETCPWQYFYQYILKVPVRGNAVFSYGKSMHGALQKFYELAIQRSQAEQGDLFGQDTKKGKAKEIVSEKELLQLLDEHWLDDWYDSKAHQEKYKKQGIKSLKEYYTSIKDNISIPKALEKSFFLKIDDYTIRGFIDRIDILPNGKAEIIDYKTGQAKDKLTADNKEQLLLYQLAAQEVLNLEVEKLTFHYLDTNKLVSFLGTEKDIEQVKLKVKATIEAIKQTDFGAAAGFHCQYCNFKDICDFVTRG